MRIKTAKWRGERPPPSHIFQKAQTTSLLSAPFFLSTVFYKILCQIIRDFAEARRINTVAFVENAHSRLILEKKVKIFSSWLGNGTPPVPLPDFNGPNLTKTIEIIRRSQHV